MGQGTMQTPPHLRCQEADPLQHPPHTSAAAAGTHVAAQGSQGWGTAQLSQDPEAGQREQRQVPGGGGAGGPSRGRPGGAVQDAASRPDAPICLRFAGGCEGAVILHLWEEFSRTNAD